MKIELFYVIFLLPSSIFLIEGVKISPADESEIVVKKYERTSSTSLSCSSDEPVEWMLQNGNSIRAPYEYDPKVGYDETKLIDKSTNFTCSARYRNSDWKQYKIQVAVHLVEKKQTDPDKPHEKSNSGFLAFVKEYTYAFDGGVAIFLVILSLLAPVCLKMRKKGILSSNTGLNIAAPLRSDIIIQTMLQQNADKLETLFKKQELLCSNQFQLLEMISALTKKVEKVEALVATPKASKLIKPTYGALSGYLSSPQQQFQNPYPPSLWIPQFEDDDEDEDEDDNDEVEPVDYDPLPHFKPIIPLPDEVVVKTGEEGDQVVYENRVKLFRFVDKDWRERGVGTYKLLKNPDTGRIRAVMRREITHKVCANHLLSKKNELTPMKTNDRAWIYCAADYADEKVKFEQFCIKFKTLEDAVKFKSEFDKYRDESALAARGKEEPLNKSTVTPSASKFSFGMPVSKKQDNSSATPKSTPAVPPTTPANEFSFGFGSPSASLASNPTASSSFSFGMPVSKKQDNSSATPKSTPAVPPTTPAKEFSFGFGSPSASLSSNPTASFSFGSGSSRSIFGNPATGFSFAPVIPQVQSSPPSTTFTVTNTSSTFTPIASSMKTRSTEPGFSFGRAVSPSSTGSIFKTSTAAPVSPTHYSTFQ